MPLPPFTLLDGSTTRSFPSERSALLCFVKEDCPTCGISMPLIEAAHRAYGSAVDIWAIGQDTSGNAALVQRYGLCQNSRPQGAGDRHAGSGQRVHAARVGGGSALSVGRCTSGVELVNTKSRESGRQTITLVRSSAARCSADSPTSTNERRPDGLMALHTPHTIQGDAPGLSSLIVRMRPVGRHPQEWR